MSLVKTITRVDRSTAGAIIMQDSSGSTREFATLTEMQDFAADAMDDTALFRIAVAYWLQRSADASNDNVIEGKVFTFDVAQNAAILEVA